MSVAEDAVIYCPVCGRDIVAENVKEVEQGVHDGYLFVRDDVVHDEDDIEAIGYGVN